ncbi:dehydrogenase/reductase SDR family member 4 [Diprion similis]|uniref:dehydrogenase/reductase SDR family member 4 n=1 Tax=Diprion similis TaxID=362088 RepID=UPI001EF8958C|nr:dehydrogenase/reductase SDR family member 4 [Diprion similis]
MLRLSLGQGLRTFASTATTTTPRCSRLQGKVAIVTASTDGIGFAIARRLAQEGANVMISSRKEKNVNQAVEILTKEGLKVSGLVCHVGKAEDRARLFEETKAQFGGLDILVSNAAANPAVGPVLECQEAVWDKIFDVNVKSTFMLMKEALPLLRERKSSSIIIVSSVAAYQPFNLLGVYSITKTSLLALCKTVADDLAPESIRVNCIAPGIIKTKFSTPLYESEAARDLAMSKIPLQRLGTTDEIAGIAAFLASEDASYITGETIVGAGGMLSRL